jgi:uncharacterized lipoprotein
MHVSTGKALLFLGLFLLFFGWGCRTPQTETPGTPVMAKTFTQGYDEVWEALEEVMVEELMLSIKKKDREKGIIQTDWISVIRIGGSLRWYVKVFLDRDGNNTLVRVFNRVEEPSEYIKEDTEKMKSKKGEIKTGWSLSKQKIPEVNDILDTLSLKLGE